ncbi:MAG TPA: hypothetical protein VGY13_13130 [Solirubrobacteraceae bacterium]|nr:hypothetical protein [Solirubrobacteraceae bacterium]
MLLAGLVLTACGAGHEDDAAVQVGATAISRATVSHWMSVIAGEGSAAPVPQPPGYDACVAERRAAATRGANANRTRPPSEGALRSECALLFEKYKLKALYFLISYAWLSGEAPELGVHVSSREVDAQLALLGHQFPDVQRFLVGVRGTHGDMLMRLRLALLTKKLEAALERRNAERRLTVAESQRAAAKFGTDFEARWRAKTTCAVGYLVPVCSGFRRPGVAPTLGPPSIPLTRLVAAG